MPHPPVSIIIVQHNDSQDTIGCLESVKELDYPNYEVIIVDNASDVNHLNSVRLFVESSKNPRLQLASSKKNLGYAGGNNLGIKKALKDGAEYILILNPDTIIAPDLLTKMLDLEAGLPSERIGIIGTEIKENSNIINAGVVSWFKQTLNHARRETNHVLADNLYIPGAAMLVKKEVFKTIGFLDERYFLYFEDSDLCLRARRAGFKLITVPELLVKHKASASTSQLGKPILFHYHYRNALLFNWKNGPFYVKIALPFWSFWIMAKQLIKFVLWPNKRPVALAILAGMKDFYGGNFGKIKS